MTTDLSTEVMTESLINGWLGRIVGVHIVDDSRGRDALYSNGTAITNAQTASVTLENINSVADQLQQMYPRETGAQRGSALGQLLRERLEERTPPRQGYPNFYGYVRGFEGGSVDGQALEKVILKKRDDGNELKDSFIDQVLTMLSERLSIENKLEAVGSNLSITTEIQLTLSTGETLKVQSISETIDIETLV
jgi:hypothetical protein